MYFYDKIGLFLEQDPIMELKPKPQILPRGTGSPRYLQYIQLMHTSLLGCIVQFFFCILLSPYLSFITMETCTREKKLTIAISISSRDKVKKRHKSNTIFTRLRRYV